MQESLFNTVQKLQTEEKINVEELEIILNSDIEEVVTLCKKACLKPKTDSMGNAYFTKKDVDTKSNEISQKAIKNNEAVELDNANKKINFLAKAKNRVKNEVVAPINASQTVVQFQKTFEQLENNLVTKMSAILSEKMDGFDEIIVELIRAKTENENLRQQVNTLNKQLYILKKELASFVPLPFGFYSKKETDEL